MRHKTHVDTVLARRKVYSLSRVFERESFFSPHALLTHFDALYDPPPLLNHQRYLESLGQEESLPKFIQYGATVEIDWDDIEAKIDGELEAERSRPGAKPYG